MKNSKAVRLALAAAIVLGLTGSQPLASWDGPTPGQVLEGLKFIGRSFQR